MSSSPSPQASAAASARAAFPFVPVLSVATGRLLATGAGLYDDGPDELEAPVLRLWFQYGKTRVPAGKASADSALVGRDREAEARARRVLESFGPVELAVLDEYDLPLGEQADYVVCLGGDDSAVCAFVGYAIPQLRSMGWQVELAPGFRWQVVAAEAPWYADVRPSGAEGPEQDDRPDWFNLELGIEVEGRRVNLLPALLDLLEKGSSSRALHDLVPRRGRPIAIPIEDRRYVLIPPERLRVLLQVLHDLYAGRDSESDELRFNAAEAGALAGLDEAFPAADPAAGELRWSGDERVRARAQLWQLGPPDDSTKPPLGLQATLRPYQRDGLTWLQHLRANDVAGVLADDMGLGKTLQTIAHIAAEKEAGRLDRPVLIVAPTSLVGNWRREIEKFAPDLRTVALRGPGRHQQRYLARRSDVVLTTYPVLVRDLDFFEKLPVHMLILDEAQAIKNTGSQAHQAVKVIDARHRLCLSGTPIENSLTELWAQFDFLMPGLLGSLEWFRHRFVIPSEREGNREVLADLRTRVAPFILRRTKEQVATELPPKTEIVRPVELRGGQRDLYESIRLAAHSKVREAIEDKGFKASAFTILDALMKLRQVCCDPRLVPVKSAQEVQQSAKYQLLFDLLEQQLPRGRRVLIFSQFTTMLGLISNGLRARDIPHVALTGATQNRDKMVETFESRKVPVFLISLKAGGTGLNLTSADTVIHYDPWWNPAVQAQATDRAYRIGQTRPVFVYNLIAAGSVEERMLGLQRRKRALADGVLGGAAAGPMGLTMEDVDGLMAPLE